MLKADTNGILLCFTDISKSKGEAPVQPQLHFPKTLQGDHNRSFKDEWYTIHPWLEYSISEDSTFCYACRHFSLPGHVESTFTGSGFKNWKKATYTDGGKEHQIAEKNQGSLMGQLNKEYNKTVEENRGYIKTLAEVVLHCATENVALRGHRESVASSRKGNFLGMLNIIANHDEKILKKMHGPRNAKYTSPDIQNEIL
ncbi:Zinc finger MYM-type protein 1 [Merluccius polli]|uniref:Zinc finger MYM-type protein 1 n=1 Tax=Merluccius polli TaxID=89951 RepID=A0AA47MZJ4_MERPO|nr:Zinc finger MYM-type protein 1 [Merluccius polli]